MNGSETAPRCTRHPLAPSIIRAFTCIISLGMLTMEDVLWASRTGSVLVIKQSKQSIRSINGSQPLGNRRGSLSLPAHPGEEGTAMKPSTPRSWNKCCRYSMTIQPSFATPGTVPLMVNGFPTVSTNWFGKNRCLSKLASTDSGSRGLVQIPG